MILYLAKKYLIFLIFVIFLMTLVPVAWDDTPLQSVLPKSVFWSGFAAAVLVDWQFRRKGIWPLYDNLGFSKPRVLGSLVAANLVLFAGLKLWL